MSSSSNLSIQETPEGLLITVSGMISERSELAVPNVAPGHRVIIDPLGVNHINSLGVRIWIEFMTYLCARTQDVIVRQLSPALVLQASMISTFLGCARVESFVTPWVCVSCDAEVDQVHPISAPLPEAIACATCGGQMELDSDPEAYLAFRSA
jgi:eukaryotic-like serine/threonine-protein kinase